ncbi:acyl-CoA dehydrogenase family protein [Humitalea sp. 24SJ18S-53]|uniref:acyl-CoA dehydrogenase family protein n=1 Tax=Humitalea sp. 24SJ18S-53 TaxID=3422307 RepID=UPI003D67AA49
MDAYLPIVSDEMLRGFAGRRARYDRENSFFQQDFDELKAAGYLKMPVPRELGGAGMTLAEVCRAQYRLAYHAPATALGINMHLYWVGLVADLWRQGDRSLEWVLKEAMEGEIFNAGHSERGHDLPVLLSTTRAERVDGGFRFTGHKLFASMSPVFTRYGLHATWADAEGGPKVVHAFMPRDTKGYRILDTWDTMGMRATRSDEVELEGAFVPDSRVARILPAGTADAFVLGIFAWADMGFASIYHAMAQRALDLIVPSVKARTSIAVSRSMAYHPEIQHAVAEMALLLDPIGPHLDRVAEDWSHGVDHGATWPARIVSAKYHAVEACFRIVDMAMELSGGAGMFRSNELEQLFRDARCGRFHPANSFLTHEIVAKTTLGIDLGEQPRWG